MINKCTKSTTNISRTNNTVANASVSIIESSDFIITPAIIIIPPKKKIPEVDNINFKYSSMVNILEWLFIVFFVSLGLAIFLFVDFEKPPFNFFKRKP